MKLTDYITPGERIGSVASLGRILGVRIRLHYTWSVAFALITAAVVTQFPEAYPLWQRIILGIVTSLLFFVSVSVRELALSFLTIRRGIPLKRVTLFVFGGAPQIAVEATSPILELLLGATGLLTTLIIAGILYLANLILIIAGSVLITGIVQWLYFIIFMLFLFHVIPGFPLDGGRVLRALLWRTTGDYNRATHVASWTGRGIGLLFIVGGILVLIIARQWFNGILLLFIGWILQSAAAQGHRQAVIRSALQGTTAQDIMTKEYPSITQQLSLGQLVRDYILVTGWRYFFVVDGAKLRGIVTMRNIKKIPKKRWDSTRIGEIMTPASKLKTAHPKQPAASLLEQMDELRINQIPVLARDEIIGVVARDSLTRLVKTRAELRI
jgi:Zn-dependent protease/CBS domain-containing protein